MLRTSSPIGRSLALFACGASLCAAEEPASAPGVFGIAYEFLIFAATLLGIAVAHRQALWIALGGLMATLFYKLSVPSFSLLPHLAHEWTTLTNLLLLLVGFAMLAAHVEHSGVPQALPRFLPRGKLGAFALLTVIWLLSAVLDNIAAALIGGTIARVVFADRIHIGYLVAIVAAANAGGAGSVIGDTTTTMMWIAGVSPLDVAPAAVAALVALTFFGSIASWQQDRHQALVPAPTTATPVDGGRLAVVALVLVAAVATNVIVNLRFAAIADAFPWLGAAVWVALLGCTGWRAPAWKELPKAVLGSAFLLALVLHASLMPVDDLPVASSRATFALGFVSAVFDNIPLTALALRQGGYDWAYLAFAVGFGGSMLWFGSSAGVAIASQFPQARSVGRWVMHGWHVIPAYVLGFMVLHSMLRWRADDPGWRDATREPEAAADSLHPLQPPVTDVRAE